MDRRQDQCVRDSQRAGVYRFDKSIARVLSGKTLSSSLFSGLSAPYDVVQITRLMLDDLGMEFVHTSIDVDTKDYAFVNHNGIFYSPEAAKESDLMVVFHEMAHAFVQHGLSVPSGGHSGVFMYCYRWLLTYYDMMSIEVFNALLDNDDAKLYLTADFDLTFEKTRMDELASQSCYADFLKQDMPTLAECVITAHTGVFKQLSRYHPNDSTRVMRCITPDDTTLLAVTWSYRAFGFQSLTNPFDDYTDLTKVIIVSPVYMMCEDGFSTQIKDYGHLGFCVQRIDIEGRELYFDESVSRGYYSSRADIVKKRAATIKALKGEGYQVVCSKNVSLYGTDKQQYKKATRKLTQYKMPAYYVG
jgi:hypothetical protein